MTAFLDSLEINGLKATHGDYITPSEYGGDPKVKGFMGGCVCGNDRGLFQSGCVCMMFYFDESEKLIHYQVDEFDKK
ncbi:MAG: hypothetical protein ACJ741_15345 [Pyrinomonadaceae bacterium]